MRFFVSRRDMSLTSSYSMLTFICPPPSASGQQLIVNGICDSSVVLRLQRSTPTFGWGESQWRAKGYECGSGRDAATLSALNHQRSRSA